MTDCNRDPLHFSSLGPKAVVADFQGGRLTTDAGALWLREVAEPIGLFDALDAAIPDRRNPVSVIHDQRAPIAQRVTAIALGYEDLDVHQCLRAEPVLPLAAGKPPEGDRTLAAPPTPCRLENRVDRKALVKVAEVLVDPSLAAHPTPPGHLIPIRADSGFCRRRLMRWCDSHGIGRVPGLARDPVPERAARDEIERAVRPFRLTGQPQRTFGPSSYAASSRDRARRVIVKAEHNARGENPRFVVADVPCDPQEFSEEIYCQRGEAENRIEEQQWDLFADRTSCHRSLANQFRLLLSSAAYVLVQAPRRTAPAGTELARAQVGTIRLKRFQVAARVVVTVRRVVSHLARSYPCHEVFRTVYERLTGRPVSPAAGASGTA